MEKVRAGGDKRRSVIECTAAAMMVGLSDGAQRSLVDGCVVTNARRMVALSSIMVVSIVEWLGKVNVLMEV